MSNFLLHINLIKNVNVKVQRDRGTKRGCLHKYSLTKFLTLASLLFVFSSFTTSQKEEDILTRRLLAHIKLDDERRGLQEAECAIKKYPDYPPVQEAYIRLLASFGKERECLCAYLRYKDSIQGKQAQRELLEEMAWGTIRKGAKSHLLYPQALSLLAAVITQDAYAVDIIKTGLKDSNSVIRTIACDVSAHLMDSTLQQEVFCLLKHDPASSVRMQAISSLGKMKYAAAEDYLKGLLASCDVGIEEKAAIVAALIEISDKVEPDELKKLTTSSRSGLRLLGIALIAEEERTDLLHLIMPLLNDPVPEVRILTLDLLGLLQVKEYEGRSIEEPIAALTKDLNFKVAITACWLLTILNPDEGRLAYQPWLFNKNEEIRRFAASSLVATGKYGSDLAMYVMQESCDPFVKLNLAIGLVPLRKDLDRALDIIYAALLDNKTLWMKDSKGNMIFEQIVPSTQRHCSESEISPEAMDQIIRLELLRMLAILHYPNTEDVLKKFLKERNFNITGLAAITLISEGEPESVELIKSLLNDPDKKIRVQAALVLGLWSQDDKAIDVLENAYQTADRELKIKILETVGRIGSERSVPFLIAAMQDPFLVIRIVASASLIICLNH